MAKSDLLIEIRSMYEKHGWQLHSILLRQNTVADLGQGIEGLKNEGKVREAACDALWFSRPSHNKGEAWELRLLAETPYALFQRFNFGESDENRSRVLKEMEERMLNYAVRS